MKEIEAEELCENHPKNKIPINAVLPKQHRIKSICIKKKTKSMSTQTEDDTAVIEAATEYTEISVWAVRIVCFLIGVVATLIYVEFFVQQMQTHSVISPTCSPWTLRQVFEAYASPERKDLPRRSQPWYPEWALQSFAPICETTEPILQSAIHLSPSIMTFLGTAPQKHFNYKASLVSRSIILAGLAAAMLYLWASFLTADFDRFGLYETYVVTIAQGRESVVLVRRSCRLRNCHQEL